MWKKVCAARAMGPGWEEAGWLGQAGMTGSAGDLQKLPPVIPLRGLRDPLAYPNLSNCQWRWKNGCVTPLTPLPSQPTNIYKEKNKREWVVGCYSETAVIRRRFVGNSLH
jgi:hypothetical protein